MEEQNKMTPEEVDASVEEAKRRIAQHKIKTTRLQMSMYTSYQLDEYRVKKERNRKRNKIEKLNKKKNR